MRNLRFLRQLVGAAAVVITASACSGVLDIEYPGRIPAEQVDDPSLANVLVTGVVGDLECAYNNYVAGNAAHSDEYETANSNGTGAAWGERGITASSGDYVDGPCEGTFTSFGLQTVMHTARLQATDVFAKLNGWTDAQVPNRKLLLARTRTYGGYPYVFFGESYCEVAFDGAPAVSRAQSLATAETIFAEAITLATAAGDNDMLNLARVGMARTKMNLNKWADAVAVASQVSVGYVKMADRGTENDRRYNKLHENHTIGGLYVIADAYRTMNDPRVVVRDAGRGAFNPGIRLWVTDKYTSLGDPIRLASYLEARLIQAEGLAQQNQVTAAMAILNARRAELTLTPLTATTQAEAVQAVIGERQRELAFEGGHRINDILRYTIPWKGANGSTKTVNDYTGRPYGGTTCWPLPNSEKSGA
jgi:hypothetical protein